MINVHNNNNTEHLKPFQSEELDKIITGYYLTDSEFFKKILDNSINDKYFITKSAKNIFNLSLSIYKNKEISNFESMSLYKTINIIMSDRDCGFTRDYLNKCYYAVDDYQNFNFYLQSFIHRYIKNMINSDLMDISKRIIESDNNDSDYLKILDEVVSIKNKAMNCFVEDSFSIEDLSNHLIEEIRVKEELGKDPNLFKTGISKLDNISLFKRGMLSIIWSFTGMGKTTITLNMILNWLEEGHRVIFFALEESSINIYKTLLSIKGGYDRSVWHKDDVIDFVRNDEMKHRLEKDMGLVNKYSNQLKIIDNPYISVDSMLLESRRFKADIVVIDNMNNIATNPRYREQEYSQISTSLNAYSIDTNSLVILIQQANRVLDRPNNAEGLKYASATAERATTVVGIYTPSEDFRYKEIPDDRCDTYVRENNIDPKDTMYVYNCKGRRTGSGSTVLKYNKATGKVF